MIEKFRGVFFVGRLILLELLLGPGLVCPQEDRRVDHVVVVADDVVILQPLDEVLPGQAQGGLVGVHTGEGGTSFFFQRAQRLLTQQITDFCKSVSHRKLYAPIQQLLLQIISSWSGVSHCPLTVSPLPSPLSILQDQFWPPN